MKSDNRGDSDTRYYYKPEECPMTTEHVYTLDSGRVYEVAATWVWDSGEPGSLGVASGWSLDWFHAEPIPTAEDAKEIEALLARETLERP